MYVHCASVFQNTIYSTMLVSHRGPVAHLFHGPIRSLIETNIDLIQQQAEASVSKDREIRELREERELLVQKLSRMRRRGRQEGESQREKTVGGGERGGHLEKRGPEVVRQQQTMAKVDQHTDDPSAEESEEGIEKEGERVPAMAGRSGRGKGSSGVRRFFLKHNSQIIYKQHLTHVLS